MMSSKSKALVIFITIFIAGIAVGVLLDNLVLDKKDRRRHGDPNEYLFKKFTTELSLTTDQQDTLKTLLDDIKKKHRMLGEKRREEYDSIRQEFDTKFREILTSEQLIHYDEIVKEFEERSKSRRERPRE